MQENQKEENIPSELESLLQFQLKKIGDAVRNKIIENSERSPNSLEINNAHKALNEYLLEKADVEIFPPIKISRTERFFEYFSPFTIICLLLTVTFGLLSFFANTTKVGGTSNAVNSGFLDICKIFAGAIVGSTSSTAINNATRKKDIPPPVNKPIKN